MAIKSKKTLRKGKIEIDLTGPEGNAYMLLGLADQLAKKIGKDFTPIKEDMTSSNYEHLIEVFNREFGHLVTFYR